MQRWRCVSGVAGLDGRRPHMSSPPCLCVCVCVSAGAARAPADHPTDPQRFAPATMDLHAHTDAPSACVCVCLCVCAAGPPEPSDRLVVTPRVPEHLDQRASEKTVSAHPHTHRLMCLSTHTQGSGTDEDTEDDDTLARDEGDLVQVTVCVDVLLDDPSGSTYTDGLDNITSSIDNVAQDGVTIAFKTPPAVVPQRPSINIRAISQAGDNGHQRDRHMLGIPVYVCVCVCGVCVEPNEPVTARMEFRVRRDLLVPNLEGQPANTQHTTHSLDSTRHARSSAGPTNAFVQWWCPPVWSPSAASQGRLWHTAGCPSYS